MLKKKQDDLLKEVEVHNNNLQKIYADIEKIEDEQFAVNKEMLETQAFLKKGF